MNNILIKYLPNKFRRKTLMIKIIIKLKTIVIIQVNKEELDIAYEI